MKIYRVICLFVLIAAISGCTGPEDKSVKGNQTSVPALTPAPTPAFPVTEPSTVPVEIKGSKFIPDEWKVVNGTTVEWTNKDSADDDRYKHVVNVSFNGEYFTSPPLKEREKWNFTFNRTGTFEYSCSNHPWMAHGRIIVQ